MSFKYFVFLSIALAIYGCAGKHPLTEPFNPVKIDFKNEGQREDYEAEQFFIKNYKVEHYKKYEGPIVLNDDDYAYKDAIIDRPLSPEMRAILDKGIFYPYVMRQAYKYLPKIRVNKDSLIAWRKRDTSTVKPKIFYKFPRMDSLRIYNFEKIKSLEKTPKQKRFRFWLFRKGFGNPTVCFMELTNKNAASEIDLLSFIDGAKLTFFQEGWIVI